MTIYNWVQKNTVGVKDVALWKGPCMAALKVAAVAAPKAIRASEESVVVGRLRRGGDVARGGRRRCCVRATKSNVRGGRGEGGG